MQAPASGRERNDGHRGDAGEHHALGYLLASGERLSNTLTTDFCIDALQEALDRYGKPEIFNTNQGSQFASEDWTDVLDRAGVRISMDGKGRRVDNVFIERLWRSVKYGEIYLHGYSDGREARQRLSSYFDFYNRRRLHQSYDYCTPDEVYLGRVRH